MIRRLFGDPQRDAMILMISRDSAAGFCTLSRQVPVAISPTIAASMTTAFSLNVPIFLGGLMQFFHDSMFYRLFRDVKPPEEEVAKPQAAPA